MVLTRVSTFKATISHHLTVLANFRTRVFKNDESLWLQIKGRMLWNNLVEKESGPRDHQQIFKVPWASGVYLLKYPVAVEWGCHGMNFGNTTKQNKTYRHLKLVSRPGVGCGCGSVVKCWTTDRKAADLIPGRGSGRIFSLELTFCADTYFGMCSTFMLPQ